ncbi:MAG: TlpA family protein disulfide reductase [Anaerolineales bacterium]|nr:TlpA family protein disulfide reductase [Anaerolineales bacterium]
MRRVFTLLAGFLLGLTAGVLILFGFQEGWAQSTDTQSEDKPQFEIGAPAPEFRLETLAGDMVSLVDFHGQIVLLNFWATWCAPCRLEMPDFQERVERYPEELVVVAVNYDEDPTAVQAFMDELNLDFVFLLDPGGTVNQQYRVRGYPSSYLIDPQGTVRFQHIGLMTGGQLDEYLVQLGLGK